MHSSKKDQKVLNMGAVASLLLIIVGLFVTVLFRPNSTLGIDRLDLPRAYFLFDLGMTLVAFGVALALTGILQLTFRASDISILATPKKVAIYIYANLAWLSLCVGGIVSTFIFFLRGYYDPSSDSIGIPTFGVFIGYFLFLVPINVVTYLILTKYTPGILPHNVFADKYPYKKLSSLVFGAVILFLLYLIASSFWYALFDMIGFGIFFSLCVLFEYFGVVFTCTDAHKKLVNRDSRAL